MAMYTAVVFYENFATNNSYTRMTPVADPQFHVSGDDLFLGEFSQVWDAMAIASGITGAQMRSPTWGNLHRNFSVYGSFLEALQGQGLMYLPEELPPDEKLNIYVKGNDGGVAQDYYSILWVGEVPFTDDLDYDYILRLSGSVGTAKAWTTVSLTPEVDIPESDYVLVGMLVAGVDGIFRIIHPSVSWRPAVLGVSNLTDAVKYSNKWVGVDTEVVFSPKNIPRLEAFATATGNIEVFMYLAQVG